MGNEGTDGRTGTQWGQFFNTFKSAIAQFPGIGHTLNGASSSVGGNSAVEFLQATKGNLDIYFTVVVDQGKSLILSFQVFLLLLKKVPVRR